MMRSSHRTLLACFFLSGFAGLIYEVAWVKLLSLLFGSTTLAVSTILAVYFGGLALGSLIFGRWADRRPRNLVRAYALVEFAVAIACLLSPFLFLGVRQVYGSLTADSSLSYEILALLKFGVAAIILIVPTTLLGGTLPLMVKGLSRDESTSGKTLATLYGLNTLGAVLGTLAAGFFFVPGLGIRMTLVVAAVVDILVGVLALKASARFAPVPGEATSSEVSRPPLPAENPSAPDPIPTPGSATGSSLFWGAATITGVAGFTSLGMEILLTRSIVTLAGSTVYAFSLILTVFLLGIGIGSQFVTRIADRIEQWRGLIGGLLATTGLLVLLSMLGYQRLPSVRQDLMSRFGYHFEMDLALVTGFSIVLVLPMSLLFGALFPLCARLGALRAPGRLASSVGLLYSINTFMGIAGSLVVGFFLLPRAGLETSLVLLGGVNVGIGVVVLLVLGRSPVPLRLVTSGLLVAGGLTASSLRSDWNPTQLTNDVLLGGVAAATPGTTELLYNRDGVDATVTVVERDGEKKLYVNGTIQASDDHHNLRMYDTLAHLPLLLANEPRRVLVIGLGSGVTVGTASLYEPSELTCVEISRDVVDGARWFGEENRQVLDQPDLELVHDDARSFLFSTNRTFDVITANAFLPSNAGTGALYAVEHFDRCRQRLSPNGVLCQWVPLFALSPDDLRCVVESFRVVFPESSLWFLSGYALLIGSPEPLRVDLEEMRQRFARIRERDARRLSLIKLFSAEQILGLCLLGAEELRQVGSGASLNTDDRPRIEYSAPKHLDFRRNTPSNLELLAGHRSSRSPVLELLRTPLPPTEKKILEAHHQATWERAQAASAQARGQREAVVQHLNRARSFGVDDPLAREALASLLSSHAEQDLAAGSPDAAATRLLKAVELDPSADLLERLAVARALAGDGPGAVEAFQAALHQDPTRLETRLQYAVLLTSLDQLAPASQELQTVLEEDPGNVEALVCLGTVLANRGDYPRARETFRQAIGLAPDHSEAAEKLATVEELLESSPSLGEGSGSQ